ncbi:Pentatricopeptide repeat-containing protein [Vitis vinifera]|uniref:Pentatricopeptide repeat-containing protein n=1 Tax=Vitis vinifera TaxID=29760 RepID=A0A438DKY0_VITVI|nr:Pentatricopeptide repeat-containing protein [Vitis vinifera]
MLASVGSKYLKSSRRVLSLLDQCVTMAHIKQIQSHLTVSGTLFDPFAAGRIISFCAVSAKATSLTPTSSFSLSLDVPPSFGTPCYELSPTKRNPPLCSLFTNTCLVLASYPITTLSLFLLQACAQLSDLSFGILIHAQAVRLGWEAYDFVQNGLLHLYASCNCMDSARRLFDGSVNRDVVTWTAVINGYAKSGQVVVARQLFDEMPEKNAVSWSAMITGYAQIGLFREALELFNDMQIAGFRPNHGAIVGALTACAFLGALDQGRWIHAYVDRNRLANHGHSATAIEMFTRMQNEGVCPNEVTFICLLSACSRVGLVEEGLRIFKSMTNIYGIEPVVQHYGCLVDLLGRAGMLEDAKRVVREMPLEPDSYVLGALLNACRVHGDVELGKETVECLAERSLDHGGVHVLLSNMYASANQWEDVAKVRKGMEEKKVKKVPGCSLIEVDGAHLKSLWSEDDDNDDMKFE